MSDEVGEKIAQHLLYILYILGVLTGVLFVGVIT